MIHPPLSELLNDQVVRQLKQKIEAKDFGPVGFEQAMRFILTDGVIPQSGLPPESFLRLEDWLRSHSSKIISFSATELKNKTGTILEKALQGYRVQIVKHGRAIAEIRGM